MGKYKIIILIIGFLILLFPRIFHLEDVQPHLSNDEISIAFDAYSLVHSGKDEHGIPFPISFLSNGIYKAPLYSYLLAPIVYWFGNTNISARMPSVLAGFIVIVGIYLLTKKLTSNSHVSLLTTLVITISPWHIVVSRMVLESNVALMFLTWGLVLFFYHKFILSALFLGLSMYGYHTEWILVPILTMYITVKLIKNNLNRTQFVLIVLLLIIPIAGDYWLHLSSGSRANTEVIWKDPRIESGIKEKRNPISKLYYLTESVANNYFQYTSPGRLFGSGLALFKDPFPFQQGLFLLPMIIPMVYGLMSWLKMVKRSYRQFFAVWFLASTGIVALTTRGNHIRDLVAILPYSIILGIGLYRMYLKSKTGLLLFSGVLFLSLTYFSAIYFKHYSQEIAESYQGYRPVALFVAKNYEKYDSVYIDDRFGKYNQYVGVPHLYFGYYNYINVATFQNHITSIENGSFDKIRISRIDWGTDSLVKKRLYVVGVGNSPSEQVKLRLKQVSNFTDISGQPAFEAWEIL